MANMGGYKSRNTCIWLEEAAMILDLDSRGIYREVAVNVTVAIRANLNLLTLFWGHTWEFL
jgi:hypothetical protein